MLALSIRLVIYYLKHKTVPITSWNIFFPGGRTIDSILLLCNASSRMELSPPAIECSITSANFTIPTFDAWCDRANRQTDTDEPPDTGISVRLPKPKPPKFPPQSASQPLVNQVSRNYPETIPKLFHRVAAGSSAQPGRSPPGGDAM
jgi:hypothetical protein